MSKEKLLSEFPPVSKEQWMEVITKDLKGADFEKKLVWKTPEGFKVQPFYRAEDLESISYLQSVPGEYPFVRGNKTDGNQWQIRQDVESTNISEANKIAVDAIARGAVAIAFSLKEVKSADDFNILFNNINLNTTKIHFRHAKSYTDVMTWFMAYLTDKKVEMAKVEGSIDMDPIAFALRHGHFYHNIEENINEVKALIETYAAKLPNFKLLVVNGNLIHNSGGTITQELGYTLAWANEYVSMLVNAGLTVDQVSAAMMFSLATGSNYFMEIAKIRAARLLWSKIIEQYQPKDKKSETIFIHSTTSKWNQTVYDPYVNMLRSTTEAMSMAIGGADSITVLPFDHAYKNPDDFSYRIARNQQILLKEESLMDKVADPSAGSYYIEELTDSIANYAWQIFQNVEKDGGFAKAITANKVQQEVAKSASDRDMDIATRNLILLGTNQYPNLTEKVTEAPRTCHCACDDKEPAVFEILKPYRGSKAFEELRLATDKSGKRKSVFLFTYGNLNMRKARAGFASNFFGCAGFEIIDNPGFTSVEEGVKEAIAKKADIVVFCGADDEYEQFVPAACNALKDAGFKGNITLAGYPKEQLDMFKAAGVSEFIHVKSNILETLKKY